MTVNVDPSNVKFDSALAELDVPSDVNILLSLKFDIVLNPVPELPDDPEVPDEPDDPEVPEVPDEPDDPEVPDVPDDA